MMTNRKTCAALAGAVVVLFVAGCGGDTASCATNTAPVSQFGSCSGAVAPGGSVRYQVAVCAECYQTSPTCGQPQVDESSGVIFLDTIVQECEGPDSCEATRSCSPSVYCSFKAPSATGSYSVQAADTSGTGLLSVSSGGSDTVTCAL